MKSKFEWRTGGGGMVIVEGLEAWLRLWPWRWLIDVTRRKILLVIGWMVLRDHRVFPYDARSGRER